MTITCVLVIIFVWPQLQLMMAQYFKAKRAAFWLEKAEHQGCLIQPHYRAKNNEGRPFELKAQHAVAITPNEVSLDKPCGSVILNTEQQLSMVAATGRYLQGPQVLTLEGGGTLKDEAGNIFHFESADIFLKETRVQSDFPVSGEGPLGQIQARSFEVREGGNMVVFKGGVRAVITPHRPSEKGPK